MIQVEKIHDMFFVFCEKDIAKYGPFEWIWAKGLFEGKEFLYDTSSLKSWKHMVWYFKWNVYLFEEINGKLVYCSWK